MNVRRAPLYGFIVKAKDRGTNEDKELLDRVVIVRMRMTMKHQTDARKREEAP